MLLVCGIVACVSCSSDRTLTYTQRYIEFSDEKNSYRDTTCLKNMRVVPLECNKQSVIKMVSKVLNVDNNFYIFDRMLNQIVVFDTHGNHIRTINHMGHGKGEYAHLVDVAYDRENEEILCLVDPSSIIAYSKQGEYLRTEKLDDYYTDIACDTSTIYLYHSTYANKKVPEYTLTCINKSTGKSTELLPFKEEYAPFCSIGSKMFSYGNGIAFVRKFDNNIYNASNGSIDSCLVLNMNKYAFPKNLLIKQYDCSEIFGLCNKEKYIYILSSIVHGDNYALFSSNLFDINVVSLKEGKNQNYSNMIISKYNIPVTTFVPIDGSASKCCFILSPSSVVNLREMYERNPKIMIGIRSEFFSDMKDISSESNPILIVYDVK